MTPKVCLVTREFSNFNRAWLQILRNLGIDYTLCVATSTGIGAAIQTPQGVFSSSSPDLRGYFRQFDAVILCDNGSNLAATSLINYSVFWLSWNDPEDPAFLFFNPHFSAAITDSAYNSNFPSDFPIVRPNANDIAGTLYAADGGSAGSSSPISASIVGARGACVLFLAENIRAHVISICNAHTNNIPYYWRLDTAKHSTLASTTYTHRVARNGRAGEVLAVPAPPISSEDTETYPNNCVIAYRYRNIFWLPHAITRTAFSVNLWDSSVNIFLFWLLYGLQLAGVRPRYRLPVQIETDHPLQASGGSSNPPYSLREQCDLLIASWDWMREFARRKGTAIIGGVTTGGRDRNANTRQHWGILYNTSYPAEAREAAMRVHQILVAGHREGATPCGPHDHTIGSGDGLWGSAVTTNYKRHAGRQRGTPNDVPIARGRCCVAPHVLPTGVAGEDAQTVQVGDIEMVEWDFTGRTSGTGTTFDLPMDNIHAARMIIEGHIDEMLALGFPDGYCGGHKYTNPAGNNSGGECYWQVLKEFGFRGIRSSSNCTGIYIKRVPPNRIWHGFHLVGAQAIDNCGSASQFSRGLYLPSAPSGGDAVRHYLLDHGSDISANWATQQVAAWRAYRRLLCQTTSIWLHGTAVELSGAYFHPNQSLMCVSLANPIAPFEGWSRLGPYSTPHYNHAVELLENMDAVVRLLPEYLYWGTITDVMDHRERVMGG
jgi:hypothetical protein